MDQELRFIGRIILDATVRLKIAASRERRGRGHRLIVLLDNACDRIDSAAKAILAQLPLSQPALGPSLERELFRLHYELQLVHELLARYEGDSARSDLPVGIVHLVDELVSDLLPRRADPIIHLGSANMYSTIPLVEVAPQLWGGATPAEPHPVAFNLPALSPANVMLSPILAHEVGHTAWRQGLDQTINAAANLTAASSHLRTAAATGIDPTKLLELFDAWRQELLCDALAAVLTGPSFLFASAVFLPVTLDQTPIDKHPYPRDRVSYTLRLLDTLGWLPFLQQHTPNILDWCQTLAGSVSLTGHPVETGLRSAISAVEPAITSTARAAASNVIMPSELSAHLPEFRQWLALEVPPVSLSGNTATIWEIVAAAWVFELQRLGDTPEALATICYDTSLNTFLVKTLELASIRSIWSRL